MKYFNLEEIIKGNIVEHPWPYKIIDNVLNDETFEIIKHATLEISKTDRELIPFDDIWPSDLDRFNLASSIEPMLIDMADELLGISKPLLVQFRKYLKSQLGYFNIPRFTYINGQGENDIHDEGYTKTMVLVIYISPDKSFGTELFDRQDSIHPYKIEWMPNRAMLMISQPGITWHRGSSGSNNKRFTLNFYYEKLEALDHFNQPEHRKFWFFEKMGNGRLITLND